METTKELLNRLLQSFTNPDDSTIKSLNRRKKSKHIYIQHTPDIQGKLNGK